MGSEAPVNVSSGQSAGKLANDLNTEDSKGGATIPSSSTIVPLPKRIGRYSIHEVLGLGDGHCFRGIDETLMRTAVKTLKNVKIEADKKEQFPRRHGDWRN